MLKSYVRDLTRVYLGILEDAKYALPTLELELAKDQQRLLTLTDTRGLPFLMVDLANLGRHLDRCLATGKYIPSGLPASRPISAKVGIPVLFRGLYLLVFDSDGCLKEDVNVEALIFLRQLLNGAKKSRVQCSDAAIKVALTGFHAVERSLPVPHAWWRSEMVDYEAGTIGPGFARDPYFVDRADQAQVKQSSLTVLDRVVMLLGPALGRFTPEQWDFSHGHGSVSNLRAGENRYEFRYWPDMLETSFPYADVAFHSYASWAGKEGCFHSIPYVGLCREAQSDVVDQFACVGDLSCPSKLIAVMKTLTKPRLIASEPVENMFCQQNIRQFMYARVRSSWLDEFIKFDDQTQNQAMCLAGSLDGSLATIDLSEASDRMTCQCVGNVFRHNLLLLQALRATRTQCCFTPDLGVVELNKYSTMGNATTFPVQSVVFLMVALAGCLDGIQGMVTLDDIMKLKGKVSVFGDDIIVPNEKVGAVIDLLEILNFKVNVHKSYFEGNFRESCGVDAFRGTNVTPVYWRRFFDGSPESYAAVIETTNNFYKRFLVATSNAARMSMRRGAIRFPDVPMFSGVTGFESFVVPDTKASKRWNYDTQMTELRLPCISQEVDSHKIGDDTAMLQFFTELPDPYTKWESGTRCRPVLRTRHRWISVDQLAPPTRRCRP